MFKLALVQDNLQRWSRPLVECARNFIISPPFQAAVQFSVGTFLAGLFVFIRPISFNLSCLASLLVVVVVAVLSPDNHIGTRLTGAATLLGAMAWGLVLGGAVLTLAHVAVQSTCTTPVGCSAHTAMLCCLSVVLIAVLSVNRAAIGPPYPPHVCVAGMVSVLAFGLVLIAGQFITNMRLLWTNVVGGLLLSCLVASGFSSLVSLLVLPSLAVDEMRADAAAAIRGIGYAASRFASRGLQQEQSGAPARTRPTSRLQPHVSIINANTSGLTGADQRPDPSVSSAIAAGSEAAFEERHSKPAVAGSIPIWKDPRVRQESVAAGGDDGAEAGFERDSRASESGDDHDTYCNCCSCRNDHSSSELPQAPSCAAALDAGASPVKLSLGRFRHRARLSASPGCKAAAPRDLSPTSAAAISPMLPAAPCGSRPSAACAVHRLGPSDSAALAVPCDAAPGSSDSANAVAEHAVEGGSVHFGYGQGADYRPPSAPTSEDERPAWPLHSMPRPRIGGGGGRRYVGLGGGDGSDFEHVLEDEDEFLRLLQEATAPPVTYSTMTVSRGGRPRYARAPPLPAVAPPGGILPSPSTRDLMGLGGAASIAVAISAPSAVPGVQASGRAQAVKAQKEAGTRPGSAEASAESVGQPSSAAAATHGSGGGAMKSSTVAWTPVSALRPLLARARACAAAAAVEPTWMMRGPANLTAWSGVLSACETLLGRVASLECLLEDHHPGQPGHSLGDVRLAAVLGVDVVSPYRLVYGEVAASCAAMSVAVANSIQGHTDKSFTAVGGWQLSKERLSSLVSTTLSSYWSRVRAAQRHHCYCRYNHRHHHNHRGDVDIDVPVVKAEHGIIYDRAAARASERPLSPIPPALSSASPLKGTGQLGHLRDDSSHPPQHRGPLNLHQVREKLSPRSGPHHQGAHLPLHQQNQLQQHMNELCCQLHYGSLRHQPQLHPHSHHHVGMPLRAPKIRTVSLHQARAMTFLWTVTEGVISAMDELETAVQQALSKPRLTGKSSVSAAAVDIQNTPCALKSTAALMPAQPPKPTSLSSPPKESMATDTAPKSGSEASETGCSCSFADGNGEGSRGGDGDAIVNSAIHAGGRASSEVIDANAGSSEGVVLLVGEHTAPSQASKEQQRHLKPQDRPENLGSDLARPHGWWCLAGLWRSLTCSHSDSGDEWWRFGWARPLVEITLGIPMVRHCALLVVSHFRTLLLSGAGPRSARLRQRLFQYLFKYWLVSVSTLVFILGLAARPDAGFMRRYPMLYAYIATSVSMTDRVESTMSRSALRAGGTLLGGVLGLWVMLLHKWADSPVGLMAIVIPVVFLTGSMASHPLLYGMYLTVGTLLSIVFCQYGTSPYCCTTPGGTLEMFAARVVSVLLGCTLPVLFSQAVLPWFTSDWALETMATAFINAAIIVRQLYRRFFDEHLRAHMASWGALATAELLQLYGMEEEAEALLGEASASPANTAPAESVEVPVQICHTGREQPDLELQLRPQQQSLPRLQQQLVGDRDGSGASSSSSSSSSRRRRGGANGGKSEGLLEAGREPGAVVTQKAATQVTALEVMTAAARAPSPPSAGDTALATALRTLVSGPLVAVQTSLMKDTTVWSRGIYAVPLIVSAMLRSGLQLADRLAALQLVVADTPPPVHGQLSGWAFERMVLPLHKEMMAVIAALDCLSAVTARLLDRMASSAERLSGAACDDRVSDGDRDDGTGGGGSPPQPRCKSQEWRRASGAAGNESSPQRTRDGSRTACGQKLASFDVEGGGEMDLRDCPRAAEVRAAVQELHLCRLQIRQHIHDMRRAFHADVRSLDEQRLSYATHPDDTVHVNSMLYALVKVLDKATA
ncbi:hypothetical protein VaNZ11_015402, partial [Volvox africanus]